MVQIKCPNMRLEALKRGGKTLWEAPNPHIHQFSLFCISIYVLTVLEQQIGSLWIPAMWNKMVIIKTFPAVLLQVAFVGSLLSY